MLDAAWPDASLLPELTSTVDTIFPQEERSIAYTRQPDGSLGAVGHTFGPRVDSWAGFSGARNIPSIAVYRVDRRERWAGIPVRESELAPTPEWLDTMRRRVLAPNGGWYQLRVTLYDRERFLGMLAIMRPRDGRPFGTRELAMLGLLVPSLRSTFQVTTLLHGTNLQHGGVLAVLDALESPAFLITRRGMVVHANPAARAVHPSPPPWLREVARRPSVAPRHASVHPVRIEGFPLFLVQQPTVAAPSPASTSGLGVRLGEREEEVARLAAEGYSVLNVASRLDVAESTVRTHLKRVYRKLHVHSRAELAHRLFVSDRDGN